MGVVPEASSVNMTSMAAFPAANVHETDQIT